MAIKKEVKSDLINKFGISEKDTGSSEIQVALLSERIKQISEHLKSFPKDKHSRVGLLKLVGKRKSLLGYLKKSNSEEYNNLVSSLKSANYL